MRRIALIIVAALGLIAGSGTAFAQHSGGGHGGGGWHGGGGHGGWHGGWHGGTHVAIGVGFPFYWGYGYPYYAGYPYYTGYPYYAGYPYYSDQPAYEPGPMTYIQRDQAAAPQSSEGQYLYYCPNPAGYYPQIQSCANGWLKVVPDRAPPPRPGS